MAADENAQDTTCNEVDLTLDPPTPIEESVEIKVVPYPDEAQIDLSDEDSSDEPEGPTTKPYDPRPGEDSARRRIAYALIFILGVVIISSLVLFLIPCVDKASLKEVLGMILSPLFTLVSAATAFYYAAKK